MYPSTLVELDRCHIERTLWSQPTPLLLIRSTKGNKSYQVLIKCNFENFYLNTLHRFFYRNSQLLEMNIKSADFNLNSLHFCHLTLFNNFFLFTLECWSPSRAISLEFGYVLFALCMNCLTKLPHLYVLFLYSSLSTLFAGLFICICRATVICNFPGSDCLSWLPPWQAQGCHQLTKTLQKIFSILFKSCFALIWSYLQLILWALVSPYILIINEIRCHHW